MLPMPAFLVNGSVIFNIALTAYKDSTTRKPTMPSALTAIVFSVVAMEAFINEMAEMATTALAKFETDAKKIAGFAEMVKYVEESRGSLEMKFDLARWACAGQLYNKGANPYQDFADLIATRNALVHYKLLDKITFAEDGSATMTEPKVLERLRAKGILADFPAGVNVAWIQKVGTPATARWACSTAAAMVNSTIDSLPEGLFKTVAASGFGKSFQVP